MLAPLGFKDIIASLLRFGNDTVDLIAGLGIGQPGFINFDAHSDIEELPQKDLVGLGAFSVLVSDQQLHIHASFGVSTVNDKNMFRHYEMMDVLFRRLLPMTDINLLDAETGQVLGTMRVTDGTILHPVLRTELRPLQYVEATFLSDRIVQPGT